MLNIDSTTNNKPTNKTLSDLNDMANKKFWNTFMNYFMDISKFESVCLPMSNECK